MKRRKEWGRAGEGRFWKQRLSHARRQAWKREVTGQHVRKNLACLEGLVSIRNDD